MNGPRQGLAPFGLSALLAGVLALAVDARSTSRGRPSQPSGVLQGSPIVPATPATWDNIEARGRVVPIEVGTGGGWYFWPPVLQWRFLETDHWATSDPIVEVLLYSPYSGSDTNAESFFLQIPVTNVVPVSERGLVIGFHGYNVSPSQIFGVKSGSSDLAEFCTQNGWFLLGPTGIMTTTIGSLPSQRALEVTLALIVGLFDFNFDRMYSMGFSAGGLAAASFAMRHQDPMTLRPAGIVYHTGTVDLLREYDQQSIITQGLWAEDTHFGATYHEDPFAYDRVNTARFNSAGTDFIDEKFAFRSLKHVPFYMHYNTSDPSYLVGWNQKLHQKFVQEGFTAQYDVRAGPPAHTIYSIDFWAAMGYMAQFEAGPLPANAEVFADRPARYLWSRMISDPAPHVARYTVSINAPGNNFAVSQTEWVDTLGLELALMGIDPAAVVAFSAASGDGTPDTYVLYGYTAAPSFILVDGGPPFAWSYDTVQAALSITPTATGSGSLVQIIP